MKKENEAIELIQKYAQYFRRRVVLFSGGKDSIVVLHLTLRALPKDEFIVLYTKIPGNTAPKCTEYAIGVCKRFGVKCIMAYRVMNFWDKFREAGFPYKKGFRWCAEHFKYKVWKAFGGRDTIYITGVKGGDRVLRQKTIKKFQFVDLWNSYALAPIYNWTDKDVKDYITKYNLPLNPLYKEIGHSGNCLWCPFLNKRSFIRTMTKYWNIATMLYEILLELPISNMPHKKGLVKGSQEVFEQTLRWMDEINNYTLDFFFDNDFECDLAELQTFWSFHLEFQGKDNGIIFEEII